MVDLGPRETVDKEDSFDAVAVVKEEVAEEVEAKNDTTEVPGDFFEPVFIGRVRGDLV